MRTGNRFVADNSALTGSTAKRPNCRAAQPAEFVHEHQSQPEVRPISADGHHGAADGLISRLGAGRWSRRGRSGLGSQHAPQPCRQVARLPLNVERSSQAGLFLPISFHRGLIIPALRS